jgi:hypothetical protein
MKALLGFLLVLAAVVVVTVGVIAQMLPQLLPILLAAAAVSSLVRVFSHRKAVRPAPPRYAPVIPPAPGQPVGWVLTPMWRGSAPPRTGVPTIDAEVIEDPGG